MALEMGLHRSESVMAKFPKANDRHLAIRVFYCIYVMDRRWSFETGMPFIIHDADIDPDLVRIVAHSLQILLYGLTKSRMETYQILN